MTEFKYGDMVACYGYAYCVNNPNHHQYFNGEHGTIVSRTCKDGSTEISSGGERFAVNHHQLRKLVKRKPEEFWISNIPNDWCICGRPESAAICSGRDCFRVSEILKKDTWMEVE